MIFFTVFVYTVNKNSGVDIGMGQLKAVGFHFLLFVLCIFYWILLSTTCLTFIPL